MGLLLLLLGEEAIAAAAGLVMGVMSGLAALAAMSFKLRQTCRRPPIDVICDANKTMNDLERDTSKLLELAIAWLPIG